MASQQQESVETTHCIDDPATLRRALDMAAAEVVLDAGYPETHGSFWIKMALTILTCVRTQHLFFHSSLAHFVIAVDDDADAESACLIGTSTKAVCV